MTWQDLIDRLQTIPEKDREQQAVFYSELDDLNWEIDEVELVSMKDRGQWSCNVGNDDMTLTWALIP